MRRWSDQPGRRLGITVIAVVCAAIVTALVTLPLLKHPPDPTAVTTVELPPLGSAVSCTTDAAQIPWPVYVTSGTLVTCPQNFDGHEVIIAGETIGDLFNAPEGRRWSQVNDDAYAFAGPLEAHRVPLGTNSGIAVLLPAGFTPSAMGGPNRRGDLVLVTGRFEQAAEVDQGGPAVLADTVEVIQPGTPINAIVPTRLRIVSILITVAAAAVVVFDQVQRRRER